MRSLRLRKNQIALVSETGAAWWPVLFLAALVTIFLLPVFLQDGDKGRFGGDVVLHLSPSKFFIQRTILEGHFPLWSPFSFGGGPFLANPERSGLLYPALPLWVALPMKTAMVLNEAIHLFLGALGMYFLTLYYGKNRGGALVTAVAFTFSEYFANRLFGGHLVQMQAIVWLPWIMLSYEKVLEKTRFSFWTFLTGFLFAVSTLAGFPEASFMIGLTLGLRFLWAIAPYLRKSWKSAETLWLVLNFGIVALVTGGLVAVQLIPTLEFLSMSQRVESSFEVIKSRSLPFLNLGTLVLPDLQGSAALRNAVNGSLNIETATYIGVVTLLLAAFAFYLKPGRVVFFYSFLALLGLFLALGGNEPLYRFIYPLPGFQEVAAPFRFIYLFVFAGPVLAGFSVGALAELSSQVKTRMRWLIILAGGLGLLAILAYAGGFIFQKQVLGLAEKQILAKYADPETQLAKLGSLYNAILQNLLILAECSFSLGLLLVCRLKGILNQKYFEVCAVLLVLANVWVYSYRYLDAILPGSLERNKPYQTFLTSQPGQFRVLPLASANRDPEFGTAIGVSSILGYDSVIPKDYMSYLAAIENQPVEKLDPRAPVLTNYNSPLVDRLNVKYVLSAQALDDPNLKLVFDGETKVYQKADYSPRAYLSQCAEVSPNLTQTLERLQQTSYRDCALVEQAIPGLANSASGQSNPLPVVTLDGPNRIEVHTDSAANGLLILSEQYSPGWKAWVDGRETSVLRVNFLFRGVQLDKGTHTIVFEYQPALVNVGAVISGMTVLLMGLVALGFYLRRGRPNAGQKLEINEPVEVLSRS